MRQRNSLLWWLLANVLLLVVFVWPPQGDKSLAVKALNWAVDPRDALPVRPPQLPAGLGDDPDAVYNHDMVLEQYETMHDEGGWIRTRLELKVAKDPFNPATERQLLTGIAVLTALALLRLNRPTK